MYRFHKVQLDNGSWRFDLNGISLILDGFEVKDERHWFKNAEKAIAYFNFKEEFYSVSNQFKSYRTVEDFYNAMVEQYAIFNSGKLKSA